MSDEKGYRAHLFTRQEAKQRLKDGTLDGLLVDKAFELWHETLELLRQMVQKEHEAERAAAQAHSQPLAQVETGWVDEGVVFQPPTR